MFFDIIITFLNLRVKTLNDPHFEMEEVINNLYIYNLNYFANIII